MNGGRNLRLDPIRSPVAVGHAEGRDIKERWNTFTEAEHHAISHGAGNFHAPADLQGGKGFIMLTTDMLSNTQQAAYSQMFSYYLGWFTYLSELVASLDAEILQYRNMKAIISARCRDEFRKIQVGETAQGKPKYMSIEDVGDKLELDPTFQDVKLELQKLDQKRLLIGVRRDAAEQCLKVVSRNIESKRIELEMTRMDANHTSRPADIQRTPHIQDQPVTLDPVRR